MSKGPIKERLGGSSGGGGVLTQSQTPSAVDAETLKEATEAKEKEREKVFDYRRAENGTFFSLNNWGIFFYLNYRLSQLFVGVRRFWPLKKH